MERSCPNGKANRAARRGAGAAGQPSLAIAVILFALALGSFRAASAQVVVPAPLSPRVSCLPVAQGATANGTDFQSQRRALARLENQAAATPDDAGLSAIGQQALAVEAGAQAVVGACEAAEAAADIDLAHWTSRGRRTPSLEERRERAPILARRARLEARLGQARAAESAAASTFSFVAERRRNEFSARVLRRSPPPISPGFWTALDAAAGTDLARLTTAAGAAERAALRAPEPRGILSIAAGFLLGLTLLFPARRWLETLTWRRSGRPAAHPAFARTARATWIALVDTGLPALAALALHFSAEWGGLLSEKADAVADATVVAMSWGAAILALGRALVADPGTSARLLSLPERTANRVRRCLWAVAVVTGTGFLLTRLNYVVGASVPATIAANAFLSVAYAAVAILILLSLRGGPAPEPDSAAAAARSPGWTLAALVLTLAVFATLGAVLLGYTTLAALISGQIFWLSVITAVTYLLLRFIDESGRVLFAHGGWAARVLHGLFGLHGPPVAQTGVLVAAALQLLVLIGALTLALTPFGQSGHLLLADIGRLGDPIRVGSATISPAAVATGLGALVVGLGLVNLVRGWVVRRYLPVTGWDAGLQNSVGTGVGYLGVAITLLGALAAMGLGFQQIALVASALSVGIGFGLQQVVQNFVSGVILLIERPVKAGDWVQVGDIEGDILRIRVRATDIQTFDRSTVIVPNSDLITKAVRNKTLGDPRGRIQLQLAIADPDVAAKARDLILASAGKDPRILADPAPAVFIDSLATGGGVNFNGFLYVASPREAYAVRSALFFEVLAAFGQAGIALAGAAGSQNIVVEPGPRMESIIAASPRPAER